MGVYQNEFAFMHEQGSVRDVATKVVETQEEDNAFFICDLRELKNRVDLWRQELPHVVPYFAMKCCTDPVVLRTLTLEGVNFDCSNQNEIDVMLSHGVDSSRIIYASTTKEASEVAYAQNIGVHLMTFDCVEELEKIRDKNARLLLRFSPQGATADKKMGRKFGCHLSDAADILRTATELGYTVVGVAFHSGGNHFDGETFALAIKQAKSVFDIAAKLNIRMTIADIGGGFPGGVRMVDCFKQICQHVRSALDLHFPASSGVELIAEPGQYLTTAPYTLAVKVVAKRTKKISVQGAHKLEQLVYLNESSLNCFPHSMYRFLDIKYHPLSPPYDRPLDRLTTVWGCSSDPLDLFEAGVNLFEVSVGDWLLMDNVGCYGLVKACGFNGSGYAPVHYRAEPGDGPRVSHMLHASPLKPGYSQPLEAVSDVFRGLQTKAESDVKVGSFFVHGQGSPQDIALKVLGTQDQQQAFYICDLRELRSKAQLWRTELPRVTPYFGMRACTDPVFLHTLALEGFNFSCSNKREIQAVLSTGSLSNRIIFGNPAKEVSHLDFARKVGVTLMTFDCVEELQKIVDKNARLLLCFTAEGGPHEERMGEKFGCSMEEAENVLRIAAEQGHSVVGVAFHVGSHTYDGDVFKVAIRRARKLFDVGAELGIKMSVLDIGGGFPGGVRKTHSFMQISEAVRCALDEHFPENSGIQIIAEPGQFLATAAYTLAVKVFSKRTRNTCVDGVLRPHSDIYVNESRENCVPQELYPVLDVGYQPLFPPYQRQRQSLTSLWGSTCYPLDLFEDAVPFFELSVGDWLLMDNVGAYGLVKACGFNGTGFPAVHYRTEPEDMARVCQIIASSAVKPGYSQPAEALKSGASLDAKLSSNISASCLSCGSEQNGVLAHQNNSTAQPCL